jgi:hypothetical protein
MKVRTITLHGAHNFGAMLQAYALIKALKKLGHDAGVIDFNPQQNVKNNKKIKFSSNLRQMLKSIYGLQAFSAWRSRYNKFEAFKKGYMNLTTHYESYQDLKERPPEADAYICGSDQIWNPERSFKFPFFLNFGDSSIRRISYAASFGVSNVPPANEEALAELLRGFHYLSVRETSAAKEIDRITERCAQVVLDPTLLLTKNEWSKVAETKRLVEKPYMLVYCLEESDLFFNAISQMAELSGHKVVVIAGSIRNRIKCADRILIDVGPKDFLNLFLNADLVVTNSFHGTAFALNFQRPLVSVMHMTRNDRMSTLLESVGWKESQFQKGSSPTEMMSIARTRAESVGVETLNALRNDSLRFIETSLS